MTLFITTACLETTGEICDPYCKAVVSRVNDANTIELSNGATVDLVGYQDLRTDSQKGKAQQECIANKIEGEEIIYLRNSNSWKGDRRIAIKNISIKCK